MNKCKWVENMILGIIALNIFVLSFVFLIPRAQFMAEHWGWEAEALMETSGAWDTPNQYFKTYKVTNRIRQITADDSIIFMPPDNEVFGSSRSVVIQRLYPRKVYFSGDPEFGQALLQANPSKGFYVVFNEGWGKEYCGALPAGHLEAFGLCKIKQEING